MIALELFYLLPELSLLALLCVIVILVSVLPQQWQFISYSVSQFSLLVVLVTVVITLPESKTTVFSGHYMSDSIASVSKLFILAFSVLIFTYTRGYLYENECLSGEYFVICLFAILGMMILVSAGSYLVIYLGLELLSLSLYALIALNQNAPYAPEAAMKYFVLGALASGIMLFGISYLYGATGSLLISETHQSLLQTQELIFISFALVFIVVGLAFKLGAVPFHMWVPDIYQGAPSSVAMLISSIPKIAAVLMAYRLLAEGLATLYPHWHIMLSIMSVLSLVLGNFIAIVQTNIKRMLAYSTIGHVGFLLLALLAIGQHETIHSSFSDAFFYSVIYALNTLLVFAVIITLSRKGIEAEWIKDFKGLNNKSSWIALVMLIAMLSFAGIPPFAGFWAKWFVLSELIAQGLFVLAAIAVITSVVAAYYYLRIVKIMYFDAPENLNAIKASQSMRFILILHGLSLLLIGLNPDGLMRLCLTAFSGSF